MKSLAQHFTETEQQIAEKAVSQQQQKFMGMVHAMQKGEKIKGASPELKKVARTMGKKDVKDFASTKHKGLPKKVGEEVEVDEDAVQDFLAKGGKIEYGKTHKPRKSEKWQGSSHIGAAGGRGSKGSVSGLGANTSPKGNKPVVTADIHRESRVPAMIQGIRAVMEARIVDEGGSTFDHILNRFKNEVKRFEEGDELDSDLYEALFDYYANLGEIPYGTMKARTGDPYEWVTQRLVQDLGLSESVPNPLDPIADQVINDAVRPEEIPAFQRKAAGKDFPATVDQVFDTGDKISHIDTLRKMAGLPPRTPSVIQPRDI